MRVSRGSRDLACVSSAGEISAMIWGSLVKLKKVQSRAANVVQVLHKNDLLCKTSEAASI